MKNYFRIVRSECFYAIRSLRFWGTTIAFFLLLLLDTVPGLYADSTITANGIRVFHTDIISMSLGTANGITFLFWLRFCLYVIPCGCCFYDEYSQRNAKYRVARCSIGCYGMSKLTACILVTVLSICLAEILYMLSMLLLGVELLLPGQGEGDPNYYLYRLIAEGNYFGFWCLLTGFKCFAGIFFSSMTAALSVFVKNKYILMAMPLALFFCLDSFSGLWFDNGLTQPDWINWRVLFFSLIDGEAQTETAAFMRTAVYTAAAVAVFGAVFITRIRKVVENE